MKSRDHLTLVKSIIFHIPNPFFVRSPLKIIEFKELMRNVKILKTDICLEIGYGDGLQTVLIGRKCKKIYGLDISDDYLTILKNRSYYLRIKISLNLKSDGFFQIIFINNYYGY